MAEFRMPSLGADMDAGTLVEWLVKPGDTVRRGDVIAVVDTDKAAVEVECFDDGVIESLDVEAGRRVPVGTVLASILAGTGAAAGQVMSPLVRHAAERRGVDLTHIDGTGPGHVIHRADVERVAVESAGTPAVPRSALRASPMARRLAGTAGLDLARVPGTGTGGAVTAADVRRVLEGGGKTGVRETEKDTAEERATEVHGVEVPQLDRSESMRRSIAALMSRSNREIPHYYLTSTIDLTTATEWLRTRNHELPVSDRLVAAALLLAATARAARDVPQLNGSWVDDAFHPATTVDLGMVVSLRSGGIMVPVISDAAARSPSEIMELMRDLVTRARTARLRSSELSAPSITVSNLGDQGVDSVLGVIYPPQVALVGFGAVLERPWAVDGLLGVRPVVTVSLAADHRASDGAIGARLLNHIDRLLQKPEEL